MIFHHRGAEKNIEVRNISRKGAKVAKLGNEKKLGWVGPLRSWRLGARKTNSEIMTRAKAQRTPSSEKYLFLCVLGALGARKTNSEIITRAKAQRAPSSANPKYILNFAAWRDKFS